MSMFLMQLRVEQRIFWRNRSGVFFTFVLPIVLLFVLALSDDPVDYAPFIAALAVLSTGFQGLAIQLSMHREQGVLKRIMATPLPVPTLIAAKAASVFVVVALELVFIVGLSVTLFGAPFPEQPGVLIGIVVIGTAAFVALGFALAALIPSSESAPAISNAAYLGLLLITGLVARLDSLPDVLRDIGYLLPLGELLDAVHRAWFGTGRGTPAVAVLVLVVWGLIGVLATMRWFRWEPAGER